MLNLVGTFSVGRVDAEKVSGRGFTPAELVGPVVARVGNIVALHNNHEHVESLLLSYGEQCVRSDRTTIANRLREAGHPELINLLE